VSTRQIILRIYISPLKMLLPRIASEHIRAEKEIRWHKMSQSVPWRTSAVPKRAHYRVKSQPLSGRPQRRRLVKCWHLRARGMSPSSRPTFYYSNMFCGPSPWMIPNYKLQIVIHLVQCVPQNIMLFGTNRPTNVWLPGWSCLHELSVDFDFALSYILLSSCEKTNDEHSCLISR